MLEKLLIALFFVFVIALSIGGYVLDKAISAFFISIFM